MAIVELKRSRSYNKMIGSITQTFFPINLILLPLIIPVVVFKSERLNDSVLKMQYMLLILMYLIVSVIIACLILPLLYIKSVANSIYIARNCHQKDKLRLQRYTRVIISILFCPAFILISFVVDLVNLPALLLSDSKNLEFKYQKNVENVDSQNNEIFFNAFS